MTTTRKSLRFLTALALVFAMIFSIASVPVSAAGPETWGTSYVTEDWFTMNGYNLTPIKTMGETGVLVIDVVFDLADNPQNVANCVAEIRTTSGTVCARETGVTFYTTSFNRRNGTVTMHLSFAVTKGDKIQFFTSAYDKNTGAARSCGIHYGHSIII